VIPAFVIGLREGLEAALIVGIIAAFLVRSGRRDALRPMWIGVLTAVGICLAVGLGLQLADEALPQRQQEGLETVIALVAAGAVTWMIVWCRRNGPRMKSMIETDAADALANGSTIALVGMAFFAVLREGLETAVFLVAVFQQSTRPAALGTGAILGIAVSAVLGYAIYRGGVRINLARFFRITGALLVLVAAGLVSSAVHTAHEATWFNSLQSQALDLTAVIEPGSVLQALVTGMFGIQTQPTVGEVLAWLLYAVPMMAYVLWPSGRQLRTRATAATAATLALVLLLAAGCGSGSGSGGGSGDGKVTEVSITNAGCQPCQSANSSALSATRGKVSAYPSISAETRTASLVIGRYCASCHMIEGEGGSAGPDLTHEGAKHDAKWLKEWISDPSTVDPAANMPPFGDRLSADELTHLANYLANRK